VPGLELEAPRKVCVAVVALAALIGCRAHVKVPPTQEGQACVQRCFTIKKQCNHANAHAASDMGLGDMACQSQETDCLRACPGAAGER
jgi:hypothetical protein